MNLIDSPLDVLGILFVTLLGIGVAFALARMFALSPQRALLLFVWHTFFALVYAIYVSQSGGDMIAYYRVGLQGDVEFSLGTSALKYMSMIVVGLFGLSFLGAGLFFSIFGFIGLLAFDSSLRHVTKHASLGIKKLATIIVFLPSVSFWSAGLGKDSLAFMSVGLALWASLNLGKRMLVMIFAIIIMMLVRPHMAALMVVALSIAAALDRNSNIFQRLFLGGVALSLVAVIVPLAMNFTGVGEGASSVDVMNYIEKRQGYNMEGGSSVDIASMSLPMQMITYLFRPFPFEARSIPALAASVDNMILLYLFVAGILAMFKGVRWHPDLNKYFILVYSMGALLILSMTTANLGIAMRQKWMFVPLLLVLLISFLGRSKYPPAGPKNMQIKPPQARDSLESMPVKRGYRSRQEP